LVERRGRRPNTDRGKANGVRHGGNATPTDNKNTGFQHKGVSPSPHKISADKAKTSNEVAIMIPPNKRTIKMAQTRKKPSNARG